MFVSLDLETTGFNSETDQIIEFGAIKFDLKGNSETLQFLCNPGFKIPDIVVHITKIKDDHVKDANPFSKHLQEVQDFIGDLPIVGHNIKFDTDFLELNGVEIKNKLYDTHDLAAILLPNMASYSLEILSEVFQLQHTDKHRALDDAIAAMELFLKLIEGFENLKAPILEDLKNVVTNSKLDIKDLMLSLESNNKNTIYNFKKEKDFSNQEAKTSIITENSNSQVFQITPPYQKLCLDLSTSIDKDSYISIPYQLFRDIYNNIPESIAKIDHPKHYISKKRLEEFRNKEELTQDEELALMKYIVWLDQTKTGLLNEVRIKGKERRSLDEINIDTDFIDPKEEEFFIKALKKDEEMPAICTHEYVIEKEIDAKNIYIFNYENFKKTFLNKNANHINAEKCIKPIKKLLEISDHESLKTLESKTTILFGILGMIFERFNDRNKYASRSTLSETIKESKLWNDAKLALLNIIEESKALGEILNENSQGYLKKWKEKLSSLHKILFTEELDKNLTFIEKDHDGEITLRQIPTSIEDHMQEKLSKLNYKIIEENSEIIDPAIKGDKEVIKAKPNADNLEIILTEKSSEDNKENLELISQFITTNKKTAILFNSRKQLEYFTLELSKKGFDIVSQLTGSTGKVQEQYRNKHETATLLVTTNAWKNFLHTELVDNLIILKTPFIPPSDPYLVAESKNSRDSFNEIQVPKAILSLKQIINRLLKDNQSPKKVIIMDPRIHKKDYGKNIIASLNDIKETEKYLFTELI